MSYIEKNNKASLISDESDKKQKRDLTRSEKIKYLSQLARGIPKGKRISIRLKDKKSGILGINPGDLDLPLTSETIQNTNEIFNLSSTKSYLVELLNQIDIPIKSIQIKGVRSNRIDIVLDSNIVIMNIFFYEKKDVEYIQIDTKESSYCYEINDFQNIKTVLDTLPDVIKNEVL